MMIIPAIVGYFVDQRFGTLILFTAIGLAIGMSAAIWQLVKFVALEDHQSETDQENESGEWVPAVEFEGQANSMMTSSLGLRNRLLVLAIGLLMFGAAAILFAYSFLDVNLKMAILALVVCVI